MGAPREHDRRVNCRPTGIRYSSGFGVEKRVVQSARAALRATQPLEHEGTGQVSSRRKRRGIGRTGGRVRSGGRTSPAHQPPLVQFASGSLRPLLLPAEVQVGSFCSFCSLPVPFGSFCSLLVRRVLRFPPPDRISWPFDRFLFTGSGQLPLRPRSKGSPSLTQFLSLCRSAVRSPATGGFVPPDGFTQPSPRLVPAASLVPIVPCSGVVRSPCGSLPHPSRVPADACSITFTRRSEWFAFPLLRSVPLT